MLPELRLNLGCGSNKIEGCINVDIEPSNNPDVVFDFTQAFPYDSDSVDAIYMFHVIEHVKKQFHETIFCEVGRVLKPNAPFFLSFPEFLRCADNYRTNRYGKRDFWEATIYGRQLYPSDTHITLMDTTRVVPLLKRLGFHSIEVAQEPDEDWNTIIKARKGYILTHEQAARINFNL